MENSVLLHTVLHLITSRSEEVITKSRIWFWLWVGKLTCCVKLNDDRREKKLRGSVIRKIIKADVKVPEMMNSWGVVAAKERKELNSWRTNRKRFRECGRWGRAIDIKYWYFGIREFESDSRWFEGGEFSERGNCVKGSWIRNPVPPPTAVEDVLLEVLGKLKRV